MNEAHVQFLESEVLRYKNIVGMLTRLVDDIAKAAGMPIGSANGTNVIERVQALVIVAVVLRSTCEHELAVMAQCHELGGPREAYWRERLDEALRALKGYDR